MYVLRVRPQWIITDADSCVPVVWLHPPLVFCQHACNSMFALTHLAWPSFHPQWLSHQHPTSHTQPDKVVPLSHCFHILLLLFGCGKSWVIHKLMWFRLRINMTSSLYIVASILAIPHWSRCEPFPHHCVGDTALCNVCRFTWELPFVIWAWMGWGEVLLSVVRNKGCHTVHYWHYENECSISTSSS